MIQFDSPGTTGDGGIYYDNLPEWLWDVSSASATPTTFLMRIWRTSDAAEVSASTYRTQLNLFESFTHHIRVGQSKSVAFPRVVYAGTTITPRTSSGGLSGSRTGSWYWVMMVVDPSLGVGNPLEVSYHQVSTGSAASISSNTMRLTDSTSGTNPNVGDLVFSSALQLEIGHDMSFGSQHVWDGKIDSLTILGDTLLTTTDLQALFDDGERFPYRMTSGNFPGPTHAKTIWSAFSPIDNPTNRDTGSGVTGPLMGDTLDNATDVWMYHGDYVGATQAEKTHVYDPSTTVENGGSEVPMVFIRPDGTPSVPASGTATGTVVNGANTDSNAISAYVASGTSPTKAHIVAYGENSRASGGDTITAGGRLWARNATQGFAVNLWSEMIGMAFKPCYLGSNRMFGFQQTSAPWTAGSPANVVSTTGWKDFARFGTGGNIDSTEGPGGGVGLTSGDAFAVYVDDMTLANLPSAMAAQFGTGGEYTIDTPMTGDSKLVKGSAVTLDLYYLKFPGGGLFRTEAIESASQTTTGTLTGYSNTSIDTGTPDVLNHTWRVGTDTYDAGAKTITFGFPFPAAVGDVEIGHALFNFESATTSFGGMNCVVANTGTVITLKHALETAPTTDSVLKAGTWGYGKETTNLPTSTLQFRGFRITGTSGITCLVGQSCIVTGASGFSVGMFGKSGAGWGEQIDKQAHDDVPGLLLSLTDIETTYMGPANQGSTPARATEYADNLVNIDNNTRPVFMVNPMNELQGGSTDVSYDTYMMGQSDYPATTTFLSLRSGDLESKVADGQQSNDPHPSLAGHVMTMEGHFAGGGWSNNPVSPGGGNITMTTIPSVVMKKRKR